MSVVPGCPGEHCEPEHHGTDRPTGQHPTGQHPTGQHPTGRPGTGPDSHGHGSHPHSGGHHHGVSADADRRYLAVALGLLVLFLITEVAVALASGSLALLADAGHMLSDAGAVAGAMWVIRLAARPATGRWTFGFKRAEVLSAAVNGITLLVVAVVVTVEGVRRLVQPPPVAGPAVLVVALVGVGVNLTATWVLARADRSSLNVEGAFQHILTDLYGFIGTAVAGLVIVLTGWTRADAVASLVVVGLLLHSAWGLVRESGKVLLEAAPEAVDLDAVRGHLLDVPEVLDVHDLHIWTVTASMPAASAHVVISDDCFRNGRAPQVLDRLQRCLDGHFDVAHSTFQLEPAEHAHHEDAAHD